VVVVGGGVVVGTVDVIGTIGGVTGVSVSDEDGVGALGVSDFVGFCVVKRTPIILELERATINKNNIIISFVFILLLTCKNNLLKMVIISIY
jgi:hypothetical protein